MTEYRRDIDGLRAIAVVPVVLFHAGLEVTPGGFVGVDIFFVISGFLITSLIAAELREDRFSLVEFYERRIRRIFPALFAVLAFTTVFCALFFLPNEFKEFGDSVVGTVFFVSNVVFMLEVDYFDTPAEMKPLLHTWSLSIEEQFYVVFPLALIVLSRVFPRGWRHVIPVLLVASFALNLWGTSRAPVATFYLAPTRAWELMMGAVLALGLFSLPRQRWVAELAAIAGLGLIAWSVVTFGEQTPFPGYHALLPCLGAFLLIAAGSSRKTTVGRLLSTRPLVFVGLISYSLYLWHWPIFVFAKYLLIRPPTAAETAGLIALSLLVSVLSWRYVEQPFRSRRVAARRASLLRLAAVAVAAAAVAGATTSHLDGLPGRLPDRVAEVADERRYDHEYHDCMNRASEAIAAGEVCRIGRPDTTATFIVWGDSHADMLVPALATAAREAGLAGLVATQGGCAPVLAVRPARGVDGCPSFNKAVVRLIERNPQLDTIVLGGYWRRQITGANYEAEGRFYVDDLSTTASAAETRAVFDRAMRRLMTRFADKRLIVLADSPEVGLDIPSILARLALFGRDVGDWTHDIPLSRYLENQKPAFDAFARLAADHSFTFVPTQDVLCADGWCPVVLDGRIVYRNGDHLSRFGAMLMVDRLRSVLDGGHPPKP